LNKKLKNAIGNSFNFPDSQHKDEFFRQVGLSYTESKKRTVTVIYRLTAAAAAMVVGAGILGALKIQTGSKFDDIVENKPAVTTSVSKNTITQPAVTTISPTAQNAIVTTSLSTIFSDDTKLSAAKKAYKHPGTSSDAQQNAAQYQTTSIVTADVSTSASKNEVSAPGIGSITTSPSSTTLQPEEKMFSIKKISAFAASLVIASRVPVLPGNSKNDINGFLEQKHNESFSSEGSCNKASLERLRDNESILDLNSDGNYDIFDVYAFYHAFMTYKNEYVRQRSARPQVPDSIMNKYCQYGDLDCDGNLAWDLDDLYLAIDYFFCNYDLEPEYFAPDFYYTNCPDDYYETDDMSVFDDPPEKWNCSLLYEKLLKDLYKDNHIASFITYLSNRSMKSYKSYSLFCKLIDKGYLLTDINNDGNYTIEDFYDIVTYCRLQSEGDTEVLNAIFTPEELDMLQQNNDVAYLYFSSTDLYPDYYSAYFFERNSFEYCYADKMFYDNMRNGVGADQTISYIKDYMYYYSPDVYDPRYNFTRENINEQFSNYCHRIMLNEMPEPDIDLNGVIDFEDFIYADILLNLNYVEPFLDPNAISEEIKKNFYTNCDFNNNRMSGDLADTVCVELYIVKKLGLQDNEVISTIVKYYKEHPELDVYDYAHYPSPDGSTEIDDIEQYEYTNIGFTRPFVNRIAKFEPRSGDANCDGTVDMCDFITIMRVLTYPDKYKLTDEGRYNADICNTGDGITLRDAYLIQQMLLEVINIQQ
jgi:hypothetical protein